MLIRDLKSRNVMWRWYLPLIKIGVRYPYRVRLRTVICPKTRCETVCRIREGFSTKSIKRSKCICDIFQRPSVCMRVSLIEVDNFPSNIQSVCFLNMIFKKTFTLVNFSARNIPVFWKKCSKIKSFLWLNLIFRFLTSSLNLSTVPIVQILTIPVQML